MLPAVFLAKTEDLTDFDGLVPEVELPFVFSI